MEMTHYMELMMGSWHMLVLFMAAPMLLAECYVVSEILLLIKPRQGGALAAFNKASAYAAALGIALLSLRGPSVLVGRRMAHLGRRRFGPRLRGRGPSVHLRRSSRGGLRTTCT